MTNPLIIHVASLKDAQSIAIFDRQAHLLAENFWPGPLTIILPRLSNCAVSLRACADLDTIALRIPGNDAALSLLKLFGEPVAGPSANISGRTSPTTSQHVKAGLGNQISMILDAGPCRVGIESTVINLASDEPVILRLGSIPIHEMTQLIGPIAEPVDMTGTKPTSPGQALSHYAPVLPIRLQATDVKSNEALLAFGPDFPMGGAKTLNLSLDGDLAEAATNLYHMILELDDPCYSRIAVMSVPETGVGLAINDRLRRAAAPRHDKEPGSK